MSCTSFYCMFSNEFWLKVYFFLAYVLTFSSISLKYRFKWLFFYFCPLSLIEIWYISCFYRNLSDWTREFWRNYRYFKHQNRHSSRQTAQVSETSKNIRKQRTGHFYIVQNCPKTHFFRKTQGEIRVFLKKSAYFRVFQPSVKMTIFCVSLEIVKSSNYSTFHSIKTSLFYVFRWLFRSL